MVFGLQQGVLNALWAAWEGSNEYNADTTYKATVRLY